MPSNTPYNYGTSAPRLAQPARSTHNPRYSSARSSAAAAPAWAPERGRTSVPNRKVGSPQTQTPIKVVPGGAQRTREAAAPASAPAQMPLFAKLAILAATLFLVIGFGRITLDSTTSALAMEASDVSTQIELVRDGSNSLEVEQSTLSNPTRIKEEASKLGMVTPESTTFIDISGDVVVTDEAGRLSLSGSVEALS